MKKKIGLIDGDSICYISSGESIESSIKKVDSLLSNMIKYNKLTHYYLYLSIGTYFRHSINKEYKSTRPPQSLKFIKTLKYYMIEKYGATFIDNVESDDVVSYLANNLTDETIICSPDKDVINQVPGQYFNYKKFARGITTKEEAYKFLMQQSLMGDSTDNIKGIPGVGESKSKAIIEAGDLKELPSIVLNEYLKYYKNVSIGVYEFQKNFRQVYLLRTDTDFINEGLPIPNIGEPVEILT